MRLSIALLVLAACSGDKETGEPVDSSPDTDSGTDSVETGNAPVIASVTLTPGEVYTDGTLDAVVSASDPDGDALTTHYAWSVDGARVGGDTPSLGGDNFGRDQSVVVTVTVSDGTHEATASSEAVVVLDTAPTAPAVEIESEMENGGTAGLRCSRTAEGSDLDGDALSYRYTWTVDGVAFTGAVSDDETGDYVLAQDTPRGRVWTCSVTPNDGTVDGAAGTASTELSGPAEGQYGFVPVLDGMDSPADMAVLSDDTLLIASRSGSIRRLNPVTLEDLGDVQVLDAEEELLAIAVDPRFGDGTHDFVYGFTSSTGNLYRWRMGLSPLRFEDEVKVLDLDTGNSDGHCGAGMAFWTGDTATPTLYIGAGPAINANAQSTASLAQKLLGFQIDDDGRIVESLSAFDEPLIAAIGLRNPWRVENCGAALCVADPGDRTWEEINLYTHAGMNFGFNEVEGPGDGTYDEPVDYWHDDDDAYILDDLDGGGENGFVNVPVVSPRFSGRGYGGRLDGWIFFGDFFDGWLRARYIDDKGQSTGASYPVAHLQYVMKFVETSDGTVYAVELGGSLQRLVLRADRGSVGPVGQALSETEYADAMPYTPRYSLWSNGADKERAIWLPEGTTVDVTDPGEWSWPEGTKVWKTFSVDGQLVETRVLWKDGGRWIPGVYQWDGDDAYLTDGYRTEVMLDNGDMYYIPPLSVCADCHDAERGREWPLGTTDFLLGSSGVADVAPLLSRAITTIPDAEGDANTQAARGWLQANCAFCHDPDGIVSKVSPNTFDLRYDAEIDTSAVAQYYHANPNMDNGDPIFDVARPSNSVLVRVIETTEMPPVAVWAPDDEIIPVLEQWIGTLP